MQLPRECRQAQRKSPGRLCHRGHDHFEVDIDIRACYPGASQQCTNLSATGSEMPARQLLSSELACLAPPGLRPGARGGT